MCHGVYLLACVSWCVLVGLCVMVCTCWLVCHGVYLLACVDLAYMCILFWLVELCAIVCTCWSCCVCVCHGVYLLVMPHSPHLGQATSGGFRNVLRPPHPPPPSLGSAVEATESLQHAGLDPRSSRGLYHSNTALS